MIETSQNPVIGDGTKEILLFQLGPVQEFIAQARSTLDLWSGSYLLSWLVAHAIVAIRRTADGAVGDGDMIKPSLGKDANPLVYALEHPEAGKEDKTARLALIPNLPNVFALFVPKGEGRRLAETATDAVRKELVRIGECVWSWLETNGAQGHQSWKDRFDAQIMAFPQITWAFRLWKKGEAFADAYDAVNAALASRRNTRDFLQWDSVCNDGHPKDRSSEFMIAAVKDSLSGKEECIGDEHFWKGLCRTRFFKTEGHRYGAMNLIKRLWCHVENPETKMNFISGKLGLDESFVAGELLVPNVPAIAANNLDKAVKTQKSVPYVAVLAFDGDHMGERVDEQKQQGPRGICTISATLSRFALDRVPGIVEAHKGHLIYAGGDDVLAILPSSKAVDCARTIREAFQDEAKQSGLKLDGSCGLAVGHQNAPLQMLVKSAQRMESVAKGRYGRQALAIAVYKRSGEILEWGCKWDYDEQTAGSRPFDPRVLQRIGRDGNAGSRLKSALDLMEKVTRFSDERGGALSGRFPYALSELVSPYDLWQKPEDAFRLDSLPFDELAPILFAEAEHVVGRQGKNLTEADRQSLLDDIGDYLAAVSAGVEPSEEPPLGKPAEESDDQGAAPQRPEEKDASKRQIRPEDFLGLFLVETFLTRMHEEA